MKTKPISPIRRRGITLVELLAERDPTHRAVLDMPFTHFFIWAYPFTTHGSAGTYQPAERELEYRWSSYGEVIGAGFQAHNTESPNRAAWIPALAD